MTKNNHIFNMGIGEKLSSVRQDKDVINELHQALKDGGNSVHDLFENNLSKLNHFYQTIATNGDSIWIKGTDKHTGYETAYIVNGNDMLVVGVYYTEQGLEVLKNGTIQVNAEDKNFQPVGYSYMTLVTDNDGPNERIMQVASNLIEYAGTGIPKIEAKDGLKGLISKQVSVVKKYVKVFVDLCYQAAKTTSPQVAGDVAANNAQTAAQEAGVVEEEVTIAEGDVIIADIGFTIVDAVGLLLSLGALALTVVLTILSKQITAFFRLYNLTHKDIEFSICWVKEDAAVVSSPMLPQDPITIPALGPAWTPPWIIGDDTTHFIELVLANTDKLKGVGYVLKARTNDDFPGFNIMVNIPNNGDNSLYVSFDTDDQCYPYWQNHKDQDTSLTLSATNGKYTLKIAANQENGESPSPLDGTKGYNYEHLVLLEEHSSD